MRDYNDMNRSPLNSFSRVLVVICFFVICEDAFSRESDWDFRVDILPILISQGCSSAECHGGATGKGGFKLSLFGTDPLQDYRSIVEDSYGRRIDKLTPDRSLVLLKPSRTIAHEGGKLFTTTEEDYQKIHEWISSGAQWTSHSKKELIDIDINIRSNNTLSVLAHIKTGDEIVKSEITRHVRLSSSAPGTVDINENGILEWKRSGQAFVLAQYLGFSDRLKVTKAFATPSEKWQKDPVLESDQPTNILDVVWQSQLNDLNVKVDSSAPDWRILRRLFVVSTGRPPNPDEIYQFLNENNERKLPGNAWIHQVIDHTFQTKEFESKWTAWVQNWLEISSSNVTNNNRLDSSRLGFIHDELKKVIREDGSWMEFVINHYSPSPTNILLRKYADPRDRAEYISRTLLGVQLSCARCHNHPDDRWTQQNHLQFSSVFSNAAMVSKSLIDYTNTQITLDGAGGNGEMKMEMKAGGMSNPGNQLFLPGTSYAVAPAFLPVSNKTDSTISFEKWFRHQAQDQFSRNFVNRVFMEVIGDALVEPVDDHRFSNPALSEDLLSSLSHQFYSSGYRLKPILRMIFSSRFFQLDSKSQSEIGDSDRLAIFTRRTSRALNKERWVQSVSGVLGVSLPDLTVTSSPLSFQLAQLNSNWINKVSKIPGNQLEALSLFSSGHSIIQIKDLYLMTVSKFLPDADAEIILKSLRDSDSTDSLSEEELEQLFKVFILSPDFSFIR